MSSVPTFVLSALVQSIFETLFSIVFEESGVDARTRRFIRQRLGKDSPEQMAFRLAMERALARLKQAHPGWEESLFDMHLLTQEPVQQELTKFLTRNQRPDAAVLAAAWAKSLGTTRPDLRGTAYQVAETFLRFLDEELDARDVRPVLAPLRESRDLAHLRDQNQVLQELVEEIRKQLQETDAQMNVLVSQVEILIAAFRRGLLHAEKRTDAHGNTSILIIGDHNHVELSLPIKEPLDTDWADVPETRAPFQQPSKEDPVTDPHRAFRFPPMEKSGKWHDTLYRLFCPRCYSLCLGNTCPTCGWRRQTTPTQLRLPIPEEDRIGSGKGADIGVGPDLLVIATREGRLLVLDRFTLQVRSQVILLNLDSRLRDLQVYPGSAIAVDERHIYLGLSAPPSFGPQVGVVVALDVGNPNQVAWVLPLRGPSVAGPAVWKGMVYIASSDETAWAVDADTGRPVWGDIPLPGWSPQPPAVEDDLIIFPARGNRIAALERSTGRERWSFPAAGEDTKLPNTPAIAGDRVYVAGWDGCLYGLDRESGERVWAYRAESGQGFLTSPLVTEAAILVGGRDHRLHAVGLDGSRLWEYDLGGAVYSRPLVLGREVYVAGDDRRLHALDLETGVPLWERPLRLGERVRVALATDGWHIIAVGRKGSLWRVPRAFPQVQSPEDHREQGEHDLAVVAYALAGDFATAGNICAQDLSLPDCAIRLYLQDGSPESVRRGRDLARSLGGAKREAEYLAAAGRYREAGDVMLAWARHREEETSGKAEEELAALFEQASRYYEQAGFDETEAPRFKCEEKVRYYRHLPDVRVLPEHIGNPFRLGEVNPLPVRVINVGRGLAKDVSLTLSPALGALRGEFMDSKRTLRSGEPGWFPDLNFEPVKPGRITLKCVLTYKDTKGQRYRRHQRWEIRVMKEKEKGQMNLYITEGATVYVSEGDINIVQGDLLREQAQKGDRVVIQRAAALMRTCPHCGAPNVPAARFCENCGTELPETWENMP